jgi:tripartite-type tricarboxylate transporter receptor subunit TctC
MSMLCRIAFLALLAVPLAATGQAFPSKPIRVVVPYAPGGAVDALARPTAQKLSELVHQPVIIDNRPGGNATIGSDNIAKSPADGYSILLSSIIHYLVPMFSKNVPYDPVKDFTPIIAAANVPNILAVHPSLPVHSVTELVDYAKKNPGKLFYGTTGIGSTHHLGGILFAQVAGIQLEHVPYKGGNPTINDALAGQIPVVILTAPTIMPHHRAGRLRALGLIEAKRFEVVPGIPAIGESLPGYAVPNTWFGFLGPANMPRPVVDRLNAEIRKAIQTPEVRQRLEGLGFEVTGNTHDEFVAGLKSDIAVFRKVVSDAGIKPE